MPAAAQTDATPGPAPGLTMLARADGAAQDATRLAMLLQPGPIGRPPAAADTQGDVQLVLIATLNDTLTDQFLSLTRKPDGSFIGKAGELRRLRIRIDPTLSPEDPVPLATLAGVTIRYDEANQAIALQVPDRLLVPYEVGLGGDRPVTDLRALHPLSGAVLNYSLYASQERGRSTASGTLEALGLTGAGILSTNALFNTTGAYGSHHFVRLDSAWRYVDAVRVRSYTVGDFASNALSWSSSVRLAGFQIASAFDQRADIVTTALPQFSGSAALPSTLDLYVNQQRIYSGDIPSGPFDLKSLPYVSGGDVKLVTTDASGRQTEITKAYYYVAGQLRKGLLEYSVDVGMPRLDYALDSFSYDETVFAAGSARYGLTDRTTLEGHVEASADGLVNGGAGIVQTFGGLGAITASAAGSRYKGRSGGKFSVLGEVSVAGVRLFAGTDRTTGDYFDLARVSQQRYVRRHLAAATAEAALTGFPYSYTAEASRIDRAGLSFTPWFDRTSVNLSYNRIRNAGSEQRTGNLSLSRALSQRLSLYTNVYMNLSNRRDWGMFASLTLRIGQSTNLTAGVDHDSGRTAYSMQIDSATSQRQGSVAWGASDREVEGGDDQRSAYIGYRAAQAYVRAQVDQDGGDWRGSIEVDGSLLAAGGGIFAANRIGNAFAIVKNAGPGVEVLQGGVRMGRANQSGQALLPDIQPYYEQQLFIDPATLPDGWEPEATERLAVAGYRQGTVVDFGARIVHGAVIVLVGADGKPIPPGYTATLDGGESAVVGYDGQVYLRGLGPRNRLTVDLGAAGTCAADFPSKAPPSRRSGR